MIIGYEIYLYEEWYLWALFNNILGTLIPKNDMFLWALFNL